MTVDQVAMHRAGIRHYHKKPEVHLMKKKAETSKRSKLAHEVLSEQNNDGCPTSLAENESNMGTGGCVSENSDTNSTKAVEKQKSSGKNTEKKSKANIQLAKIVPAKELHTTVKYENVGEALNVFKDDDLLHKPGKQGMASRLQANLTLFHFLREFTITILLQTSVLGTFVPLAACKY